MNFNRETLLLTGGSGLLSINWAMTMRDKKNIILGLHNRNIDINNVTSSKINLESIEDIIKALQLFRPRIIVHTAGLTNVELCESNMDLAYHINVKLASNVAIAAADAGVKMVHISTDHLYDGTRFLVDENEPLSPKNNYGITKAKAEEAVSKANPDALIIRSNFYAWGPLYRRSFSDTIIDSLRQKKTIILFEDVFYSPILAETLVEVIHELVDKNATGVFNVTGNERVSKFEFGQKVASVFQMDASFIKHGLIITQPGLVKRPADMSLSNKKVTSFLERDISRLDDDLRKLYLHEQYGLANEIKEL